MQWGDRQPSEDCLLLDIYAPATPASQGPLPVLLYIHGGGYELGSTTSATAPGIHELAYGAPNHFIAVFIQYRLSGFGFLGGDEVEAFGQPNAGLADQRLAMEWVQRHISSFGGDPSKVTLQGPSAGGGSVAYQYIWQGGEANPPFRAAIADLPWWQRLLNKTELAQQYQGVLNAANCSNINCLRSLSASQYFDAQQAVLNDSWRYPYGTFYFGPYVDGDYIRNLPSLELQAGHFSRRPLITDHDGNEGLIFTPQTINTQDGFEKRVATVFPATGRNFRSRISDLYPPSTSGLYGYNASVGQQLRSDNFFGDAMISCPSYYLASSLTDAGVPVHKYVYTLPTFSTSAHGDLEELFVPTPDNDTSPSAILGRQFLKYYIPNFIITTNPNDNSWMDSPTNNTALGNVARWPAYGADSQILIVNSTTTPVLTVTDLDATGKCDFFWAHSVEAQI
jgi:carboxylesterase type B